MLMLNLGCGAIRPEGWENIDSSLNAHLQKIPVIGKIIPKMFKSVSYDSKNLIYMNLNKRWKYDDNSVDIAYSSHTLEHLTLRSADLFLKEAYRCLKPGGVFRVVVPDLYKICKRYIDEYEQATEGDPTKFVMWAINMHREGQYGDKIGFFKKMIYEKQGYPHQHKFMYDVKSLTERFKQIGFVEMRSKVYGESEYIAAIKDVEGKEESYLSVYLEAKKPG
jgi:SAM-dependent methyltransferase